MVSTSDLVLVTGASGFIAARIVALLLESGYRVRGTARGAKVDLLREAFKSYPKFEVVSVDNITSGDFTEALKGVKAVLHVASPISGKAAPEQLLKDAINGTLNVLRQAHAAGIYKFVATSSWATFVQPDLKDAFTGIVVSERGYGKTSAEDLIKGDHSPLYVYCGSKILAEESAWKFADEHPEVDLATINPPFVYGRPTLNTAKSPGELGTNRYLYELISGDAGRPLPSYTSPFYVHISDVALAHVRALELPKLPPDADIRDRRFLVSPPDALIWSDAVKYLAETRPDLKDRLPTLENASPLPGTVSTNDATRARDVLSITDYVGWKQVLDETIPALLEAEKAWA